MITRVRIENWKSHLKSELKFAEGTNALVGIMGSGKTSVLDAITFGLFGTFSALQQRRVKLENIIRAKPNKAEFAEVSVSFTAADGKEYEATRRIEKGASTAELRQAGTLVAIAPARVNEAIESLLKLDFDLYSRAIYSEQNQIDNFLRIARGQRMKRIDELLRIDKFENARKNCVSVTNQLADRADNMEKLLAVYAKDITGAEELAIEASKLKRKREQAQTSLREKTEGKRAQQELVNGQERLIERTSQLEGRIATLEDRKKSLGLELENYKKKTEGQDREATEKEIKKLESGLSQTERELEQTRSEHSSEKSQYLLAKKSAGDLASRMERMEQQLKKRAEIEQGHGTKERIEARVQEIGNEIEKGRANRSHLQARKEISEKSISELAGGQCPVCESDLTPQRAEELAQGHKERIKGYQRGIAETENANKRLSEERAGLENALRALEKIIQETADHGKTKIELAEAEEERQKHGQKTGGLEETLKNIQAAQGEAKKELENSRELARTFAEKERRGEELEKTSLDLERKRTELSETKFDKEAYLAEKEKLSRIIDEWNEISKEFTKLSSELLQKEARLKEMMDRKTEIDKMRSDIQRIRDSTDYLLQFQNALLATQESLRKEFIESVNDTLEKIWAELYPYGDYRSARLSIVEGDYVLQLLGRDGWTDVEGIVSGGERSTAALALRIAFSLVLAPHLKWLVLDEPTHNLDPRGIETLASLLRDKIGAYVSQVFLITHEEKLEQAVTGYLYRMERNKDTDEPTRVVRAEA